MKRLKTKSQTSLRGSFASLIKTFTIISALMCANLLNAQVCDGGLVSLASSGLTTEAICVDGVADVISFNHSTSATAPNYSYIITNDANEIIGLPPANSADFDPAGVGTCLVYGISYDGVLNAMSGVGMNVNAVTATGCSDLSDNHLSIVREEADGGMVTTTAGTTSELICIDGLLDEISFATTSAAGSLNYAYVVTNNAGDIIGLPPANTVEFDGAGIGTCYVYGVSFSGTLNATAGTGMNISAVTATGCHELSSNFVSVVRDAPDGGMVRTLANATSDTICIDGILDEISFKTTCSSSDLNYSFIVTNDANEIIGLPPANTVEFDGAGIGTCYVYGISYLGTLNATAGVGMNISMVTASGCYELSGNFVSIVREDCSLAMSAPENLTAAPTATQVNLSWSPVAGAVNYRICGRVAGTSQPFRCIVNTGNSKLINGLTPGKSYEWFLTANAGGGVFSDPSAHHVFTTALARAVATDGHSDIGAVEVYPIPATERIQLTYSNPSSDQVNVLLTDLVGRQLDQKSLAVSNGDGLLNFTFEVSSLPTGLYFIVVKDGAHSVCKRVQITH